jgi:excinuclease ABC subunit C
MAKASEALRFEEAARLRDLITEVEDLSERRKLASVAGEDVDVYGVHVEGGNAAIAVLVMRGGQVLDRRELFWEAVGDVIPEALLSEVVPQIYARTTFIPKEVHLPAPIDDEDTLTGWLSEKKGERVYLRMPARGPKAHRVELAGKNAKMAWKRRFRQAGATPPGAEALRKHLHLLEPPRRVEGFDVSTFQGGETVASLVVWEDGKMRKRQYRSFNIRGLDGASDDFFSIHQAVARRYRRHLDEAREMPDLILIDGGRGQLNAALEALASLGVEETPVVGLAKREEEVHRPEDTEPLRLPRSDAGLKLLQEVRDEAHRFAVDRHRRRRSKRTLRSRLDDLPGVGPKRKKQLLQRFGSLQGVREAGVEELQDALGPAVGRKVFEQIHRAEGPTA